MKEVNTKTIISPKEIILIYNILRDIGLNITHKGTKYINKAVQLLYSMNNDIVILEDIYDNIANYYDTTPKQVKNAIAYSLNSRINKKTIKNFEKIFGFEYDVYYFTNKTIIEEIARIIKVNTY